MHVRACPLPLKSSGEILKDSKQDFGGKNGLEKLMGGRPQTNDHTVATGASVQG